MKKDPTLLLTGIDSAIVGWIHRTGDVPIVIYDRAKVVKHFVKDGMTEDEAEEWVSFNVEGAWVGKGTPGLLHRGGVEKVKEVLG
jgi:hypothetical protein